MALKHLFSQRKVPGLLGMCRMSTTTYNYETLSVSSPKEFVFHVQLNRPEKLNTMNKTFWREIPECFDTLGKDPDCRAVVLSGAGKMFTAGLDFGDLAQINNLVMGDEDIARKCRKLKTLITSYQESFTSLEKCPKPVIAAIHNACIGGGVDLICAADIRYCTNDAWFQIKEVEIGLTADVGTLQRLPKIIGSESLVRELAFTARRMQSEEALEHGFVSRRFVDKEALIEGALALAETIASKSPVAVQGTKETLLYARDHPVPDALEQTATMNMSLLQSEDVRIATMSIMQKEEPTFSKL